MSKEAEFLSQFSQVESMDALDAAAGRPYGGDKDKADNSRNRHNKAKRNKKEREQAARSKPAMITVRLSTIHRACIERLVKVTGAENMTAVIADLIDREARERGWLDAKD